MIKSAFVNWNKLNSNASQIKRTSRVASFSLFQATLVAALALLAPRPRSLPHSLVEASIARMVPATWNKTPEKELELNMVLNNLPHSSGARHRSAAPFFSPTNRPAPSCLLGTSYYPIGARWQPLLPGQGIQRCVRCECTLQYQAQSDCYEPVVTCQKLDRFPHCPDLADACPEGLERRTEPGYCCPVCLAAQTDPPPSTSSLPASNTTTTTTTTERPKQGSLWLQSRRPPTPVNSVKMEPHYDSASGRESFWLFKVISRSSDERELISAVKQISFCPTRKRALLEHHEQASWSPAQQHHSKQPQRSAAQSARSPAHRHHQAPPPQHHQPPPQQQEQQSHQHQQQPLQAKNRGRNKR